ncbi:ABC transporter permease [bacterium]|nr:ABC transporter permease [bacterium]
MNIFLENIRIAFFSLGGRKLRTFLTILGIAIGVTTIIFIHTVLQSAERFFQNQFSTLGSHTIYIQVFSWGNRGDWFEFINRPKLTEEQGDFLEEKCDVLEVVNTTVSSRKIVKFRENGLQGVRVTGTTPDLLITSPISMPESGRFLTELDHQHRKPVVILGSAVVEKLFPNKNPLGERVKIGSRPFTVIGTMKKRGNLFGQNLDQEVIIPLGTFRKYFGTRRWLTLEAKVRDEVDIEFASNEVESWMRIARGLKPMEKNDFSLNRQNMIMDFYKNMTGGISMALLVIGSLALFVGGIGIMNIMLVTVSERTREIGVRKALGGNRRIILGQFLFEALFLSFFGGLVGMILGFLGAGVLSHFTPLPAVIAPSSVILGVLFSGSIGLIFGIYPAAKASKLDPVLAIQK